MTGEFQGKSWRRCLRRLAKPAVAIAATLLGLFVCEALVRSWGGAPDIKAIQLGSEDCVYQRSTNPILGFELKANYRNPDPDLIRNYERTNAHGQRDRERTVQKPAGVRRVLLLGDSVVEGYGLREADTISSQLNDLYPDGTTEVLNLGVSAYCTRAEVELLEVKGLQFDPDVVILVFVENDFDNFNREAFPLGGTIERPAIAESLFVRSHLFRMICVRWDLFHFGAEMDPVRWNQDAIGDNNVVEGLARFRDLAQHHGFQPVIAIWPRFYDDRIEDVLFMPKGNQELVIERLAAMYSIPSVRLSAFFQRDRKATAGDVNPRLHYSLGDELHPSKAGCRVAAAALKQVLADLDAGRVPVRPDVADSKGLDAVAVERAKAFGADKPTYARVYNRMGTDLLKAGKPDEAVAQFKKAIEEDPGHGGAHYNLGIAYERLGRGDAQRQFEQAVRLEPTIAPAHFRLAQIYLKQGRTDEAIAGLRKTIQIDPNHVRALSLLGVELGKRARLPEAQAHLERAIRIQPDYSEAHNNLGVVYCLQGKLREAVVQFQEAVRADPTNDGARAHLNKTRSLLER